MIKKLKYQQTKVTKGRESNCKRKLSNKLSIYIISVDVTVFCFHFSALSKGCSFKWVLGLFKWIFTTDSSTQFIIQVHGESMTYSSTLTLDSSYQRLLLPSWSTSSTSCKYLMITWLRTSNFLGSSFLPYSLGCQETNSDFNTSHW